MTIQNERRDGRRKLPLLVVLLWLACLPLGASAQFLVHCTGTETATFTPGLTNTPTMTQVSTDTNLSSCVHLLVPPLLMPATSSSNPVREYSCLTLIGGGTSNRVINWANGETSHYTAQVTSNIVQGNLVVVRTGVITAGRYAGRSIVGTVVLTPLLGSSPDIGTKCATPEGLTSLSGVTTLEITL